MILKQEQQGEAQCGDARMYSIKVVVIQGRCKNVAARRVSRSDLKKKPAVGASRIWVLASVGLIGDCGQGHSEEEQTKENQKRSHKKKKNARSCSLMPFFRLPVYLIFHISPPSRTWRKKQKKMSRLSKAASPRTNLAFFSPNVFFTSHEPRTTTPTSHEPRTSSYRKISMKKKPRTNLARNP
jgi:hypothetical protein